MKICFLDVRCWKRQSQLKRSATRSVLEMYDREFSFEKTSLVSDPFLGVAGHVREGSIASILY